MYGEVHASVEPREQLVVSDSVALNPRLPF